MEMMRQTPSSSAEVGDNGESPAQPATKITARNINLRLTISVYNEDLTAGRVQLVRDCERRATCHQTSRRAYETSVESIQLSQARSQSNPMPAGVPGIS